MGQTLTFLRVLALAAAVAMLPAGCATTPAQISRWAATGDYAAVKQLEAQLYSPDPQLRQVAAQGLVKIVAENNDDTLQSAVNALDKATISPDPEIRGDVGAITLFKPEQNLDDYSITLLADPDPSVRKKMAVSLAANGRVGPLRITQRASIYLWGLTQDSDPGVRAAAIEGAGSLGLDDPIGFALDALRNDPDARVRAAAARGLGLLAHAYLAGGSGPDWRDATVERFLSQLGPQAARTPTQVRGEDIVAALIQSATNDAGTYDEVYYESHWFTTGRYEVTHYVAADAAAALTVPGITPRADVAAAMAAAHARVPATPPPPRFHPLPFRRPV